MKISRSPASLGPRGSGRTTRSLALAAMAMLLAPLGLSLGPAGCFRTCTLAECSAGFNVLIDGGEGMGERLESAVYVITAEADGGVFEVECSFDDAGEGECDDGEWTTGPSRDLDAHVSVDPADWDDPSRGSAIVIHFEGSSSSRHGVRNYGPEEVEVTVTRDGATVAMASYAPEYTVQEDFNGEGCGDCEHGGGESLHAGPV